MLYQMTTIVNENLNDNFFKYFYKFKGCTFFYKFKKKLLPGFSNFPKPIVLLLIDPASLTALSNKNIYLFDKHTKKPTQIITIFNSHIENENICKLVKKIALFFTPIMKSWKSTNNIYFLIYNPCTQNFSLMEKKLINKNIFS